LDGKGKHQGGNIVPIVLKKNTRGGTHRGKKKMGVEGEGPRRKGGGCEGGKEQI